jgi:hypothetical protein
MIAGYYERSAIAYVRLHHRMLAGEESYLTGRPCK